MDWIELAQYRDRWRALVNTVMNLRISIKCGEFLDWLLKKDPAPCSKDFVRRVLWKTYRWRDRAVTCESFVRVCT